MVRPVVGAGCRWLEKTLTAEEERRRRKSTAGRRKRGKRGERKPTVALGGRLVVALAACGVDDGGKTGDEGVGG